MVEDLYAIALAYYQAPLQYPKLAEPSRALPEGLDDFLESVGGEKLSSALIAAADYLNVPEQELLLAALFYIKQVLFAEGADYYRVLGLQPTATAEDIKHQYRLLIRIFHPDREAQNNEWNESYAPRVIKAYDTLNKPDKRIEYDRQLLQLHSRAGSPTKIHSTKTGKPRQSPATVVAQHRYEEQLPTAMPRVRPWYLRTSMMLFWGVLVSLAVLASLYFKVFEGPTLLSSTSSSSQTPQAMAKIMTPGQVDAALPLVNTEDPFGEKVDLSKEELAHIFAGKIVLEPGTTNEKYVVRNPEPLAANTAVVKKNLPRPVKSANSEVIPTITASTKPQNTVVTRKAVVPARIERPDKTSMQKRDSRVKLAPRNSRQQDKEKPVVTNNSELPLAAGISKSKKSNSASKKNNTEQNATAFVSIQQEKKSAVVPSAPKIHVPSTQASLPVAPPQVKVNTASSTPPKTTKKNLPAYTEPVPQQDLTRLIDKFVQSYEQGELTAFVQLFAKTAKTNKTQGRENIRQEYRNFFANSNTRKLTITKILWQRTTADLMQGRGDIEVSVHSGIFNLTHQYSGSVQFKVERRNGSLQIAEFFYHVQ